MVRLDNLNLNPFSFDLCNFDGGRGINTDIVYLLKCVGCLLIDDPLILLAWANSQFSFASEIVA